MPHTPQSCVREFQAELEAPLTPKESSGSSLTTCRLPACRFFEAGLLRSRPRHNSVKKALDNNMACSYWTSSRDRIMGQFVVWDDLVGSIPFADNITLSIRPLL